MTHGNAKRGQWSAEFKAWIDMRKRCNYRNGKSWKHYGGRGIIVCERWNTSFLSFLDDMGRKPSPRHELDRMDNNGNYEPGNCRWATRKEQCANTRRTAMLTINGVTKSRIEWCKEYGIQWHTFRNRIKAGLSPEEAVASPVRKYIRKGGDRYGGQETGESQEACGEKAEGSSRTGVLSNRVG